MATLESDSVTIRKIHPALLTITEPRFASLIEKLPIYGFEKLSERIYISKFSISLMLSPEYADIRFYDEQRNNFATMRFTHFGDTYYFVYKLETWPATKDQLFDSLSSESEGFIEWILWNQILC